MTKMRNLQPGDMHFDGEHLHRHHVHCRKIVKVHHSEIRFGSLGDPANRYNWFATVPCPECGGETGLNCNLEPDHPNPDAAHIEELLKKLGPPKDITLGGK